MVAHSSFPPAPVEALAVWFGDYRDKKKPRRLSVANDRGRDAGANV
jgi:hypothetical protein